MTEKSFLERKSPDALEVRAILAKHSVKERSLRLYREGILYNTCVRGGDVTPELAPVESPEESWTRMDVDHGDHDEQEEADQPEYRWASDLERQKHFQMSHALGAKSVSKPMEQEHNTADRQSRNWQSKNRMDPESTQTLSTCRRQEFLLRCLQ